MTALLQLIKILNKGLPVDHLKYPCINPSFYQLEGKNNQYPWKTKRKATGYTNQQTSSDNTQTTEMQIQASL